MVEEHGTDTQQGSAIFREVPVQVTVTVGRARPTISDLLSISQDTVFELDTSLEDAVELFVGDRLIARGQLEELDDTQSGRLGVRITEVVTGKSQS